MQIFTVRHPPADIPAGTCYGRLNPPAKPGWQKQVRHFSRKLRRGADSIDLIISSPSRRCSTPAKYLSKLLHRPIITDERIMEMYFGKWEGMTYSELWEQEEYRDWMENWKTASCAGGESLPDMTARVGNFLNSLNYPEKAGILLFTHAGVIRILRHLLSSIDLDEVFQQSVDHMLLYPHPNINYIRNSRL